MGAGIGAALTLREDGAAPARSRLAAPALPGTPRPGLDIGVPHDLRDVAVTQWAPLRRAVAARARADASSPAVARLARRTPEGTSNLVVVLARAHDRAGRLWLRARLPTLRDAVGWLPRAALGGYGVVDTRLVVDRHRLTATLVRAGRAVFRAPIGIGRVGTPTPAGTFYIRDKVTSYASPTYGPIAFGTSARSAVLTDWPGGGFVGIHGTDHPEQLPGRVSHGCIRLRNADIMRLGRLMPVGTPLTIR